MIAWYQIVLYVGIAITLFGILIGLIFGSISVYSDNNNTWINVVIIIGIALTLFGMISILIHVLINPHNHNESSVSYIS